MYFEIKLKVEAQHHGLSTPLEGRRGTYVRMIATLYQKYDLFLILFIFLSCEIQKGINLFRRLCLPLLPLYRQK